MSQNFKDALQTTPMKIYGMRVQNAAFGLEIEIEGDNLPGEINGWKIKEDNSLRGNSMEYITTGTVSQKALLSRVKALNENFKHFGSVIHKDAYRASTHIHYNVQNMTFKEILGAFIIYTIIEPVFLRMCGKQRDGNLFCMSTYDTGDSNYYMKKICKALHQQNYPHVRVDRGKYSAFNTNPITSFGSVEFRAFPSSTSEHDIFRWTTWIQNIMSMSCESKDPTYMSFINKALEDPEKFASQILTETGIKEECQPNTIPELVGFGCETAYELTRIIKYYWNLEKADDND